MRIRWKLLILLLAMSLVPLIALTFLSNRATIHLGQMIGDGARETLTEMSRQQLGQLVEDKAQLIGHQANIVSLALSLQAQAVKEALAIADPPEHILFMARDYDQGEPPPDLGPSPIHLRIGEDGRFEPVTISTEHSVFKLAPGVNRQEVRQDMLRLVTVVPTYRQLHEDYGEILHWQFTSLENGVHNCYPGHGGYPADYDARQRRWYVRSRIGQDVVWTLPYTDASTGRAVLTAALPVRYPDETLAGVTAIDVTVSGLLEQARIPRMGSATAKLVSLNPHEEWDANTPRDIVLDDYSPDELGMFVVAEPSERHREGLWHSPMDRVWLQTDTPDVNREIVRDMYDGKAEVRQVMYKGKPTLWAYGPIWGNAAYLVVIAPQEEVVADAVRARHTVLTLTDSQVQLMAILLVIVSLLVFLVAFAGSRTVTRPVRMLAEAAQRVAGGDLNARVRVRTRDELGELANTFNRMVPQLRDRLRIRQALTLAMEVQQNLLPAQPPTVEGLDIAGRSIYCDETGGDYYDFIDLSELGPRRLGLAVGDVTGHGIAAALLMTTARALLRGRAGLVENPASLLRGVNRLLCMDTPPGRFMTLFYAVVDGESDTLRWANAGHDPAIVYDPSSETFDELQGSDLPLGIEADEEYQEFHHKTFDRGQVIVVGTDGIWETRNAAGEVFGKDRLRQVIKTNAAETAGRIADAITDAIQLFRGQCIREDDVTLVVVKVI